MMEDETAVKRRKIKFGILFTGLTLFTLVFFVVLARFFILLIPVAEERTTLQAQPIVRITATYTPTAIVTEHPPATSTQPAVNVVEQAAVNRQQGTINNQQSTINEEELIPQSSVLITEPPAPSPQPPTPNPPPAQLIIPSLGVSKTLEHIPVENGQWNLEELASGIGHLQTTGEHPGDDVGMTFVGHVTRPWPEIAGPFADLIFMQPGDEIIYRWDGFDYVYGLESFARVKPEAVEYLYVQDGDMITLATCDSWDYVEWTYADRLLAYFRLLRKVPTPQEEPMLQ